jgi:histidinol-phosphate aminotransferase
MTTPQDLIRADVLAMSAYPVPDASGFIKLDAMENPFDLPTPLKTQLAQRLTDVLLNRYPVPSYRAVKEQLAARLGVPEGCPVMLGNGSDELIHLVLQACAKPGAVALAPLPGFVMYEMSARLNGVKFVGVPLAANFSLNLPAMLMAIAEHKPAVIFIAYPNNPTGNLWSDSDIEQIVRAAPGLVVIDEAYHPFAQQSWMNRLAQFDKVLVMRTLSKLGLAGIRLGYMAGSARWIEQFEKVRPPYNVNVLTEAAALFMLEHLEVLDAQAAQLRSERTRLFDALRQMKGVTPHPSAANFILTRVPDAAGWMAGLKARGILIKNVSGMHPLLSGCLRLTVGTPQENDRLIAALTELAKA